MPSTLLPFIQTGIGKGPWIPAPNSSVPGFDYFRDDQRFDDDQVPGANRSEVERQRSLVWPLLANNELLEPQPRSNWNSSKETRRTKNAWDGHIYKFISPNILSKRPLIHDSQNEAVTTALRTMTNQILKIQGMATIPTRGAPV